MSDCKRCGLVWLDKRKGKPLSPYAKNKISSLKRYIDRLNDGQMLTAVEVMDCLGLVAIYIDVAFNINCDQL